MKISDDLRRELEEIIKKWINLLGNLEPKFMDTLKLQLDYEDRLENLKDFLIKEVENEIEMAYHAEFPKKGYTSETKEELKKITAHNYEQLLETIKKLE